MRRRNCRSLAVKAERKFESKTSLSEAELQISGSPSTMEVRKRNFKIVGSQDRAEVRNFRTYVVKAEQKCGSETWLSFKAEQKSGSRSYIFERNGGAEVRK